MPGWRDASASGAGAASLGGRGGAPSEGSVPGAP